ncbi:uncharacterized protein LOC134795121 [Cydia splendana]|uniref:uncharacterized protein LOC134795121 n=1 Tax=Cydia splendana TaxID=1100963 RepID=UPI00300CC9F7
MAQFTFEGDIKILADPQIKLVENVLQEKGFTSGKIVVEQVGQKGDNYIAHVKRFIYEAEDGTTFKMIGKVAPVDAQLRRMMKTMILFNNETVMYNLVLPKLNDIQNSAGATADEKVRFPACYGVVTEEPYEFILLEDLKEAGFEMFDRMKPLTNESVRLVVKDLAQYHSLSYVFKNSEPEMFESYSNRLLNMWVIMGAQPDAQRFFESAENDLLKMMYDVSDKYKNVLRGSLTQIAPIAKKMQSYEKGSKYSVIQQGDCWNNNILFRLEDGKLVDDVMIDYQLSREGNPAADLLYLIFNCTDHATRLKHYQEWIDYYHEILDDSLNLYGLKANRVFPKDQLDADLRRYGKLMVNLGVMLSSILVRESKDVVDIKEMTGDKEKMVEDTMAQMDASLLNVSTIVNLRKKILGIIDTALEFGLIHKRRCEVMLILDLLKEYRKMAQFAFEGDIEILADPQIKLVENVLQKKGFTSGKIVVEQVGQKGDNYIAHVKRFIYESEDGTTFKMIGKVAPVAEQLRLMMKTMILFNNEIVMYNLVLPKLNDIQNSAGATDDVKVRFPACYGVVTEEPYEFILLEDLNEAGFEMLDRMKPLTNESVRLVVKDLAKYHSLSYVFKNSEPEIYESYSNRLLNMWVIMGAQPEAHQLFKKKGENDLLKMMHDVSDKYKNVLRGSLTQIAPIAKKMQSYEKGSEYSVIQQGDCWNNNILFRLEDGKSVDDVMIDYQLSREGNPAADLLYLIFNCTDHATRLKHYQEWIDYYHEILDDSLNLYGLKANRVFPKDQLDADLRRYGKLMVSLSVMLSSIIVRDSKDAVDMKEMTGDKEKLMEDTMAQMDASLLDVSTIVKLREKILGIIDTAFEFGLI